MQWEDQNCVGLGQLEVDESQSRHLLFYYICSCTYDKNKKVKVHVSEIASI